MQMTVEEIQRNYRLAKDKKKQIEILADLNLCEQDEIKKIIGIEIKRRGRKKKESDSISDPDETENERDKEPDKITILKMLYKRLDLLDKQTREMEYEYEKTTNAIEVLGKL